MRGYYQVTKNKSATLPDKEADRFFSWKCVLIQRWDSSQPCHATRLCA